jgi:ubiquinone/menaquinone biosynthesis C-methylase UbiE
VNYDPVAHAYDRRYELHDYPGVRTALLRNTFAGARVLELGCGTGKWLADLAAAGCQVAGIDPSQRMLDRAHQRCSADLRHGTAESLPWPDHSFDRVVLVNALHHLAAPDAALRESFRVLKPGGAVTSIGLDPHEHCDRWFVYDYFPETLQLDLSRFPSLPQRTEWLHAAGFTQVTVEVAERLHWSGTRNDAHRDGLLNQSFTSQLHALTPAQYTAGLARLPNASRLEADLTLFATRATKSKE